MVNIGLKSFCSLAGAGVLVLSLTGAGLPSDDAGRNESGPQVFESTISTFQNQKQQGPTPFATCQFDQRVDSPHISNSDGPRAVQAHGNWGNKNCNYSAAIVKTQLDKENSLGFFIAVGRPGEGTLPPEKGMGRGSKVTARYECQGTTENTFRAWTDVDILGIADLPNKVYSANADRACG